MKGRNTEVKISGDCLQDLGAIEQYFTNRSKEGFDTLKVVFLLPYLALTLVCHYMAWLGIIIIIILSTWISKSTQFVVSGSILFLPPYTRGEKKNIWSELESNPGPLASQATALTTRPWLLRP